MQKPKQSKNNLKNQKSTSIDWFEHVNNDHLKLAIPVGPRFQADVPEWSGPRHKMYPYKPCNKSESSKYIGTIIWSTKDTNAEVNAEVKGDLIGKGRADACDCYSPGSVLCVKRHISEKRFHLQNDLGAVFQKWKFDEMGEAAAMLWKQSEEEKFAQIVKNNLVSEGKSFLKPALECFPSKSRSGIVSYYFNVYLPRRISVQTRSGCTNVDTDDDEEKTKKSPCSKGSRKRARVPLYTSKLVKAKYLTGRR